MAARRATALLWFCASLAASSCAGPPYRAVPEWVDKPPQGDERYIYAVGVCHRALFEKDKENLALADARQKLAASRKALVKSHVKISDDGRRRMGSADIDVIGDGEVPESEHLETWRDADGLKGVPGAVYVLVRMPRRVPKGFVPTKTEGTSLWDCPR